MKEVDQFQRYLEPLNITLEKYQYEQFLEYYDMLIEKNKVMNLTAITEFNDVILKHFIDSLSIVKILGLDQNYKILDLGTGAGFPGIPLKIVFPHLDIVLLDSLNKRVVFLEEVIHQLKLTEISAIHGRAEDYGKNPKYREQFDFCVSRAVSNLATLSEYCLPYVKIGGKFISYKSGTINEEVKNSKKAIHLLGGKLEKVEVFQLPESDIERSFVMIRKENTTPKLYPRNSGKPSKEPIM